MLELTHVALLVLAMATAKIGLIDRRAELLMFPTSMVLFAAYAYGSYGIEKSFASGTADQPGMFVLGIGGVLVMLAFTLLAATNMLPSATEMRDGSAEPDALKR